MNICTIYLRPNPCNLVASLARVNFVNKATCQCITSDRDIEHILWHCPLYTSQRIKLVNDLKMIKIYPSYIVKILLIGTNRSIIKYLQITRYK